MLCGRERLVQGFEHLDARLQKGSIIMLSTAQALDKTANGRCVSLVVLGLFEVEIVHDAADVANGRVRDRESIAKGLERAVHAVMPELGLERIEWNRLRRCRRQAEHESCLRIDEPPNEPGR